MFSGPLVALTTALAVATLQAPVPDASASPPATQRAKEPARHATVTGKGGAVTSVDTYASRIGPRGRKQGGNAGGAAIAPAAAPGVTQPYSSGPAGGGYFVYYDAKK